MKWNESSKYTFGIIKFWCYNEIYQFSCILRLLSLNAWKLKRSNVLMSCHMSFACSYMCFYHLLWQMNGCTCLLLLPNIVIFNTLCQYEVILRLHLGAHSTKLYYRLQCRMHYNLNMTWVMTKGFTLTTWELTK